MNIKTIFLDCGCCIRGDGSRLWCPSCESPIQPRPKKKPGIDPLDLQAEEFTKLDVLCESYRDLPAIVDDDYPEARHEYEAGLRAFIQALRDNGRIL